MFWRVVDRTTFHPASSLLLAGLQDPKRLPSLAFLRERLPQVGVLVDCPALNHPAKSRLTATSLNSILQQTAFTAYSSHMIRLSPHCSEKFHILQRERGKVWPARRLSLSCAFLQSMPGKSASLGSSRSLGNGRSNGTRSNEARLVARAGPRGGVSDLQGFAS